MERITFHKKYVWGISLLLTVIIIAAHTSSVYRYNQELKQGFVLKKPQNVYARREELTKDAVLRADPSYYRGRSEMPIGRSAEIIRLGATVCYYKKPGDWIPAKVFWRGTNVIGSVGDFDERGIYEELRDTYRDIYGFCFRPSYQKGWRIVIPFVSEKEYYQGIELDEELYYVRTSDVKRLEKVLRKKGLVQKGWSLRLDKELYEEGYYLSPDLYRSYFPAFIKGILLLWLWVIGRALLQNIFRRRIGGGWKRV